MLQWVSEWVSEHLHIPHKKLVSTLRVSTSLKMANSLHGMRLRGIMVLIEITSINRYNLAKITFALSLVSTYSFGGHELKFSQKKKNLDTKNWDCQIRLSKPTSSSFCGKLERIAHTVSSSQDFILLLFDSRYIAQLYDSTDWKSTSTKKLIKSQNNCFLPSRHILVKVRWLV